MGGSKIGGTEALVSSASDRDAHEHSDDDRDRENGGGSRSPSLTSSDDSVKVDEHQPPSTKKWRLYLFFGMCTTTLLGVDVATNRYLQNIAGLSGVFIITLRAAAAFGIWIPFIPKFYSSIRRMRYLWLFAFLHTINPVLNTYSVLFTVAYVAQSLKLTSPFFVAGVSYFLKYPLPRYTWPALALTGIGGFLTITGDFTGLRIQDLYGSLLSLSNAFVFALNTFLYSIIKRDVQTCGLTFLENFLQFLTLGTISFSIDNWTSVWSTMTTETMIVLALTMLSSIVGAFGRVAVIRVIGAPLFSAMAPWELVVTLGLSVSPFLNDRASLINIIGVAIVTISLTMYLYTKYLDSERLRREVHKHMDGDLLGRRKKAAATSPTSNESSSVDSQREEGLLAEFANEVDEFGVGHTHSKLTIYRKFSSFFNGRAQRWGKWGSDPNPRAAGEAYVKLPGNEDSPSEWRPHK